MMPYDGVRCLYDDFMVVPILFGVILNHIMNSADDPRGQDPDVRASLLVGEGQVCPHPGATLLRGQVDIDRFQNCFRADFALFRQQRFMA